MLDLSTLFLVMVCALAVSVSADAEDRSTIHCKDEIDERLPPVVLGMSTALSGPNQYLGLAMSHGVRTRLEEVNAQGGICGRQLVLRVKDDSYDPDRALANTRELITEDKVIALVGNVGTPTAEKSWPLANKSNVVFYGAYTGAGVLRETPPQRYVFNYRASYDQEMLVIVDAIIRQGIPLRKIEFFLQGDGFGKAGLASAKRALKQKGFKYADELQTTYYPRNSLSIQSALESLIKREPKPEAIIIVGAYRPSAEYIRFAHGLLPRALFYNLSFPGASELSALLPDIDGRVYITQVVPPCGNVDGLCEKFVNEVALEGYLSTGVLVQALEDIEGAINSESLRESLERVEVTLIQGHGSSNENIDHQIVDKVWLAELFAQGKWVAVRELQNDERPTP
ncbi:MAG: ABC transporter substrate-binding protein [Gammaproteobacteria bacterium]|nr:ABC transporter substrate-binding protein [Gammaproteobacteria bacterium]